MRRMSTVMDDTTTAGQSTLGLAWMLSQAGHALVTQQQSALEALGITPRGHCVMKLADTGTFSQIELTREIGLDKTTMVVTIDALEKDGLVERRPSPKDRRAHVIAVTAAGRKKVAEAAQLIAQSERDVLAAIPEEQRTSFLAALATLVAGPLDAPTACSSSVRRRN